MMPTGLLTGYKCLLETGEKSNFTKSAFAGIHEALLKKSKIFGEKIMSSSITKA